MDPKQIEALEKKLAELKALNGDETPAATPAVVDAARKGDEPVTATPNFELDDPEFKGKGLMFVRTVRAHAMAKRFGGDLSKIAKNWKIPEKTLARALDVDGSVEKALGESTLSGGGVLTPEQFSAEFIEILRPKIAFLEAGATMVPMSSKTLTIGRQSGHATPTWIGESQNITKSQQTFDQVTLDLKKLAVLTPVSNDLLRDNSIAADVIVRNDLLAVAKREADLKCIRGLGSQYTVKGMLYAAKAANKFNSNAAGTPTLTTALADGYDAIGKLEDNDVDIVKAAWFSCPRTFRGYAQLRDGTGRPYFEQELAKGEFMGFPVKKTTQIPTNLSGNGSGGSSESELYLAELSQIYVGMGLQPTIEVARNGAYYDGSAVQSGLSRDETAISCIMRLDMQPRHPEAIAVVQGVVDGS